MATCSQRPTSTGVGRWTPHSPLVCPKGALLKPSDPLKYRSEAERQTSRAVRRVLPRSGSDHALTCMFAGIRRLVQPSGTSQGLSAESVNQASMADRPRAPACGMKWVYVRSVNAGSECPSHFASETIDSPASSITEAYV